MKFDKTNLQIIKCLQEDARKSFTEIAKTLGLPTSVVHSRFEKMKKAGLILGTTVIVDRSKFGIQTTIMGIKTVCPSSSKVLEYLKNLKIGPNCSVYCFDATLSHYNIFLLLLHRDVLDIHLVKDMVLEHPGVIEVNANLITSQKTYYNHLNLANLIGKRI